MKNCCFTDSGIIIFCACDVHGAPNANLLWPHEYRGVEGLNLSRELVALTVVYTKLAFPIEAYPLRMWHHVLQEPAMQCNCRACIPDCRNIAGRLWSQRMLMPLRPYRTSRPIEKTIAHVESNVVRPATIQVRSQRPVIVARLCRPEFKMFEGVKDDLQTASPSQIAMRG